MLDGIKGFFTSKRGIGLCVGCIFTLLATFTPIDIDTELRTKAIEGITWLVLAFITGTSVSDAFGKGNTEAKAKLLGLVKTGFEIFKDAKGDLEKAEAEVADGGSGGAE